MAELPLAERFYSCWSCARKSFSLPCPALPWILDRLYTCQESSQALQELCCHIPPLSSFPQTFLPHSISLCQILKLCKDSFWSALGQLQGKHFLISWGSLPEEGSYPRSLRAASIPQASHSLPGCGIPAGSGAGTALTPPKEGPNALCSSPRAGEQGSKGQAPHPGGVSGDSSWGNLLWDQERRFS